MKLNDELYILEVPMPLGDPVSIMNLSLIVDPVRGITLIDTGLPNQADLIEQKIVAEGFALSDVKWIVLTHQDIDHVGSLNELKERTGATVFAYVDEIPYIDGTTTPIKMPSPDRLAQNPGMAEIMSHYKPTVVDRAVRDGETLSFAANALAIATPGHTPCHMSLYLPRSKTLIAGDSLLSEGGILSGPHPGATPNMDLAIQSVRKYLDLDIETIMCYHGGIVRDDPKGQLRRVVG